MNEREEKQNKTIALITAIGIHALLFLSFLFVLAWRSPNPPLPEYGIELNFGLDSQGSGDVQPVTPSGTETPAKEEEQQVKNEKPDDEIKPVVEDKSQPDNSKPVEQPVTTKQESPISVKEEKKAQPKPVEKPVEKPKEKLETKPEVKPKEAENKATITADKTTATDKEGKPVSQGEKTGKTGDQGDPKGTPDAKGLFPNQGGGANAPKLEMDGWDWNKIPNNPNVPNNETGKVVIEILVNAEGDLVGRKVIVRGPSLEADKACLEEVEKLTFTRKYGAGLDMPPVTKGIITFFISAK
jgi:outer membrane biosynthesis protein TonB